MNELSLAGIVLEAGLLWTDEFDWSPTKQSVTTMLDGSQYIETGELQAGRLITLTGDASCWVPRTTVVALYALLTQTSMQLRLVDGRQFAVTWRHSDKPIEARPIRAIAAPAADEPYQLTLKLMTV